MIPFGDSLRSRTFPWVNYALIIANFAVFFWELTASNLNTIAYQWGAVPCLIVGALQGGPAVCEINGRLAQFATGPPVLLDLFTSMFIHGGWLHILGNMLFLWVFGDNVEDAMGHVVYLLFYLVCGIGAGLGQVFAGPQSATPAIGASGAIAGVLAAYLILYPRASVRTIIPIIIIPWIVDIPAFVLMLVWFGLQLISSGVFSATTAIGGGGGVAYMAHVAGFLLGLVIAIPFRSRRRSVDRRHPAW